MPYDNVPTENAPALPARIDEYKFEFDITGMHADGLPRASLDDLDLFSPENSTTNKQMLDFLDRVVTKVTLRGEVLVTHTTVKETYQDNGEAKEREVAVEQIEGVRGKKIPYMCLKALMQGVGQTMREANDPGN